MDTYLKYATVYADAKKDTKIDTTRQDWQSKVAAFDGPESSITT